MTSKKCRHPVLEIEEFSSLGVHVRCLKCQNSTHIEQEEIENLYLPFTHTANSYNQRDDIHIYLRKDVLDLWPSS